MRIVRLGGTLLLVGVFVWGATLLAISLFGRRDEARPADAIVVLGAAQYQGRPSPVLRARLDHALDLYRSGVGRVLVFTGGLGAGDTISEGEVARRYAERHGVPDDRILVEGTGVSSGESLRGVAGLLRRHGLHTVVLVSDPFHMLRLRILAAALGMRAYSSPTRSSPIRVGSPEEWRHVVRESLILPIALAAR
jgi:uncharacterized SAM-binding protein YcdF (DUF218 family)